MLAGKFWRTFGAACAGPCGIACASQPKIAVGCAVLEELFDGSEICRDVFGLSNLAHKFFGIREHAAQIEPELAGPMQERGGAVIKRIPGGEQAVVVAFELCFGDAGALGDFAVERRVCDEPSAKHDCLDVGILFVREARHQ